MKNIQYTLKMFALGLAVLVLAACGNVNPVAKENDGTLSICHATGKTDSPYEPLTLDFKQLTDHSKHPNDLIPAPAAGCPKVLEENVNNGKITICHATGSAGNPYNKITIALSGLNGHSKHAQDIIPAPLDGCAPTLMTPTITLTPTITPTPTITLTPTITPTPAATIVGDKDGKVTICHATGNGKKGKGGGYVMITISVNGLNGHNKHAGDIIPAPAGGCPK